MKKIEILDSTAKLIRSVFKNYQKGHVITQDIQDSMSTVEAVLKIGEDKPLIEWKDFLKIADEEIVEIVTLICECKVQRIIRYPDPDEVDDGHIVVEVITDGWDDGNGGTYNLNDEVELFADMVVLPWLQTSNYQQKYQQFMIAKGYYHHHLVKDNPWLEGKDGLKEETNEEN